MAVFDAVGGVEPQSETVWRQADRYGVPRLAFINKMDRVGADLPRCLKMMRERLKATPVLLQLPLGEEDKFQGMIDLINLKAFVYDDVGKGMDFEVVEIPEAYAGTGGRGPEPRCWRFCPKWTKASWSATWPTNRWRTA